MWVDESLFSVMDRVEIQGNSELIQGQDFIYFCNIDTSLTEKEIQHEWTFTRPGKGTLVTSTTLVRP